MRKCGVRQIELRVSSNMAQEVTTANHSSSSAVADGIQFPRSLKLGCELSCTTVDNQTFRGNLVAHDAETMLIVLKENCTKQQQPSNPNSSIHIINLRHTSKIDVTFEPSTPPTHVTQLPQLDLDRIRRRLHVNTEAKLKEIRSRGVNVTQQAQQLYNYISKMYNDIEWENEVIVVLKDVRISPPYSPEDCEGSQSACNIIKKQVAKFHMECTPH